MSLFRRFSKVQQSGQLPSNHSNFYPAPIERGYTRGIFHRTGSVRMLCSSPKRKRWKYWNTKVALRLQYVLVAYIGYKLGTAIFTYTSPTPLQLEKEMKEYLMSKRPEQDEYFDELVDHLTRWYPTSLHLVLEDPGVSARRLAMVVFSDNFLEKNYKDSVDVIHIMEEAVVDVAFVTNNDEEFIAKVRR
eukprot:304558_1